MDLCNLVYNVQTIDEILTGNSPTNRIIEDPIVVRVGTGSTQDTVIPFSAVLDKVDVNVVSLNAISVAV